MVSKSGHYVSGYWPPLRGCIGLQPNAFTVNRTSQKLVITSQLSPHSLCDHFEVGIYGCIVYPKVLWTLGYANVTVSPSLYIIGDNSCIITQKFSCCTIEILLICNDDQKDFLMVLLWSAFGIPDAMDICVLREQVLPSRSYPYHQSHNEIKKVFFEEQKWPLAHQKPYNAQWNQKVLN